MRKHLKRIGLVALVTSALVVGVIAGLKVANYYSTPRALNVQTASASGHAAPAPVSAPTPAADTTPTTPDTTTTAPAPDPTTTVAPPPTDTTTTVAPPPPSTDVTTTTEFVPPTVPTCDAQQAAIIAARTEPDGDPITPIMGARYNVGGNNDAECIYEG